MNQYDHLKKNLRGYKVEVDKEKLWQNTSHAIPQKRKKRAALFLLSSAIILSAIGYTYVGSDLKLSNTTVAIEEHQHTTGEIAAASIADVTHDDMEKEKSFVGNETALAANSHPAKSTTVAQRHKRHKENVKLPAHPDLNLSKELVEGTLSANEPDYTSNTDAEVFTQLNENNMLSMSTLADDMQGTTIRVNDGLRGDAHNLHEDEIAEAHKDELRLNPSMEAVAFLAINLEGLPVEARTGVTGSHNPRVKPAEVHHLSSIQVIQGIGLTTISIQSLAPESNELATQLSKTHESLETFSNTVSGNLKLPIGFSIDAGIQYHQLNTKLEHQWTTTERYTREGVSQIIIDQHGLQESVTGNIGVTKFTNTHAIRYTEHKNIDLIASLRKTIWKYRRSSLDAFVKGGLNLLYRADGSLLNKDGSVEKFSPSDNPYQRSTPFTYGAGLQFQYRITSRIYFNTAIDYQSVNYLYQPGDQNVEFRFGMYGGALGMGYSL